MKESGIIAVAGF